MRKLLKNLALIAGLFAAHSLFGYSYTSNYCCNSTESGFNTTTCASPGGGSGTASSISCTVTVAANQTVFVWGFYGIAFTPTPVVTDNCSFIWSPGGRSSGSIDGIATYPFGSIASTGSATGSCTVTMAPTNGPDFMYIMALVYDVGAAPVQDPAGVLVGDIGGARTTDTITYPPTSYSNEVMFCVHSWEGQDPTVVTLSGGSGETVRFNIPKTFTITVLGVTHYIGIIVEDFITGAPSSYNSVATSSVASTANGWGQVMIPTKSSTSVAVQGEKRRRITN